MHSIIKVIVQIIAQSKQQKQLSDHPVCNCFLYGPHNILKSLIFITIPTQAMKLDKMKQLDIKLIGTLWQTSMKIYEGGLVGTILFSLPPPFLMGIKINKLSEWTSNHPKKFPKMTRMVIKNIQLQLEMISLKRKSRKKCNSS